MEQIYVKNLTKSFKQYKKEAGLAGSIKGVFRRKYFQVDAVKDISFDISKGEIVGFIGPNGAGKTTTLKMLSGILYPTSGEVKVNGFLPFERKFEFLKTISLVMGQKSQLWWDLPAMEGFILNKEIFGISKSDFEEVIQELGSVLEINDFVNIPIRKLSLGQRMKCELLAALIHRPSILFLDEPTIGLDIVAQKKIREFFKEYNRKYKTTIMLTSHYMDDVQELCNRIIIINKGSKIYDGGLKDLTDKYVKDKNLKIVFREQVQKDDLKKFGKILKFNKNGLEVTISVPKKDHANIAAQLLQTLPVDDLDIAEIDLEEIIGEFYQ